MFVIRNKLKVSITNGWHELPWLKGLHLFTNPHMSDVEIMALLTDKSEDEIRAVNDTDVITKLLNTFFWIGNPPDYHNPELPKVVKVGEQVFHVPFVVYNDKFDLGNTSVGAIEDMKATIKRVTEGIETPSVLEYMQAYPEMVAIYLQSLKGYDYNKAMAMVEDVKQVDFKTVYNIGNFFLWRLGGLRNGFHLKLSQQNTLIVKLQRAYWILMQRLVGILPWIR